MSHLLTVILGCLALFLANLLSLIFFFGLSVVYGSVAKPQTGNIRVSVLYLARIASGIVIALANNLLTFFGAVPTILLVIYLGFVFLLSEPANIKNVTVPFLLHDVCGSDRRRFQSLRRRFILTRLLSYFGTNYALYLLFQVVS